MRKHDNSNDYYYSNPRCPVKGEDSDGSLAEGGDQY